MNRKILLLSFLIFTSLIYGQSENKYYSLGIAELKSGNTEKAIKYFDTVINLEESNVDAYLLRGYLKGQLKDFNSAIEDFNTIIKIDPKNSTAYDNRGICNKNLGDYQAALSDYNIAININDRNENAYHNRAVVKYYFLADTIGACYDWHSSANLGYKQADQMFVNNCYARQDIKTKYANTEIEIKRRKQGAELAMKEEEFRKLTKELNIAFNIPDNFIKTDVIANSNMPYYFAIKHKNADFEIRFYIESFAKIQEQMKQLGASNDSTWFN
ncbi:MAG: tetratricopeptide repeat protein [Bacteroidales bacterium]|nr:tetratricopeptide repeat protein [Bacteroidales bacterium]MBN2756554.1 tetratricopeptide repeat protein [Bacteroidales bacterium]